MPRLGLFFTHFAPPTTQDQYLDQADLKDQVSLDFSEFRSDIIYWKLSNFTAHHITPEHVNPSPSVMSEDLFLSKVFAQSMHPSKIIPFFYRASDEFDKEDITITTLVTSNRFKVFSQLVESYQGAFPRIRRLY